MHNKKIKVLLFNPLVTAGGLSKLLSDYINNFSKTIDVEMMTLQIRSNIFFDDSKIKIHELGLSKNFFKRMIDEYKIIKNNKYDIVHVNGDYCTRFIECMVAKKAGVKKVIIHSHNTNSGSGNKLRMLVHFITKKLFDCFATDFFACSDDAAKWMFSKKVYKNKKYHIIKNGIPIERFKYDEKIRKELSKELNLNNKFVIGHIGRFQYQKNHDFLVDVFYEVQKKNKNAVLLLIGTGELECEIRDKIKKLKIEDKVLFLGNRADAYKFFNLMDCFVFPSHYEGLGIVVIEAQASGLQTFVYRSIPDEANISNRFVKIEEFDAELWANKILKVKSNNRENACRDIIRAGYDIKDVVKCLEKKYYN